MGYRKQDYQKSLHFPLKKEMLRLERKRNLEMKRLEDSKSISIK